MPDHDPPQLLATTPFEASINYQLALIASTQKATQRSVERLEAAVLGVPETDTDGLLTRMSILEDRAEEVSRKAGRAGTAAAGSGVGAIIATLIPFIREMLSNG